MLRRVFGLLIVGVSVLALVAGGNAQEKDAKRLKELVGKFATAGKFLDADKKAADEATQELLKDPTWAVAGIVDLLSTVGDESKTKGADTQVRLALHAVVVRAGAEKDPAIRKKTAEALVVALNADRPKEIQGFLIRELQLVGEEKQAPAIGKKLLDADLASDATQALLAIKGGAAEQFREALPKATGKQRVLIINGLGVVKDKKSAEAIRKFLDDEDRDTKLTAAWALANLPDAASGEKLLKLADVAKGYERTNLTESCFVLAANLLAAGDKSGANKIYTRLHDSRTDDKEKYIKEAAAKGQKASAK